MAGNYYISTIQKFGLLFKGFPTAYDMMSLFENKNLHPLYRSRDLPHYKNLNTKSKKLSIKFCVEFYGDFDEIKT